MPANPNNQIILDITGERSPNHPYAVICRMRCQDCGHEYGANSCDTHNRGCPRCQGKAAGFPVQPETRKSIVPDRTPCPSCGGDRYHFPDCPERDPAKPPHITDSPSAARRPRTYVITSITVEILREDHLDSAECQELLLGIDGAYAYSVQAKAISAKRALQLAKDTGLILPGVEDDEPETAV